MVEDQPAERPRRGRGRGNLVSNLFALAALVFALLAVVLYLRGSQGGVAPVPTAAPGHNQIVNVTQALKAQGLDVQQPPGRFIPIGELDVPGQGVEINGNPGFIFLFDDAEVARRAAESVDPNQVVPEQLSGTPAPAGARRMAQASNVMLLLIGGDDETWQRTRAALGTLP